LLIHIQVNITRLSEHATALQNITVNKCKRLKSGQNVVGMLNEYRLFDYPNSKQSSNLKIKNRYLNFSSHAQNAGTAAVVYNCVTRHTGGANTVSESMGNKCL